MARLSDEEAEALRKADQLIAARRAGRPEFVRGMSLSRTPDGTFRLSVEFKSGELEQAYGWFRCLDEHELPPVPFPYGLP